MDWRDVPSLPALRAFEAAARAGSFSAAARELNVTHAAIAQHVRALETHFGTSLLNRAGKGMALTDAGTRLATDLSDGFAQIIGGVRRLADEAADSPLKLTVTPSFADNWLMPRLSDFWEKHPEITLTMTPDNTVTDLRRDGYDMAIRYGMGDWAGLDSTFLVSADYVIVSAPALVAGRTATGVDDLQDIPWVFEKMHREHRKWAIERGLDLACCQLKELATLNMVLAAVRAGAGISVISRALVADDLAAGRLLAITEEKRDGLGYYACTLPGVPSAKVKTFRRWLLKQT
ncbi:LysR family transcriptional regulator [Yoonia sp. 208BN28-4]|uniref:LysR family transcriptional regulator n=1 Tax=Yoonia sp. 208BN28-4 TaxID=3126505 RepID=UPI0030965192